MSGSDVVGPPAPGVLEEEVGGELLLHDPASNDIHVLNSTAADIWRLSSGKFSAEGIVERLAAAYGVEPDQIRTEVVDAVEQLISQGLLLRSTES